MKLKHRIDNIMAVQSLVSLPLEGPQAGAVVLFGCSEACIVQPEHT
jgi:hypothetical protein